MRSLSCLCALRARIEIEFDVLLCGKWIFIMVAGEHFLCVQYIRHIHNTNWPCMCMFASICCMQRSLRQTDQFVILTLQLESFSLHHKYGRSTKKFGFFFATVGCQLLAVLFAQLNLILDTFINSVLTEAHFIHLVPNFPFELKSAQDLPDLKMICVRILCQRNFSDNSVWTVSIAYIFLSEWKPKEAERVGSMTESDLSGVDSKKLSEQCFFDSLRGGHKIVKTKSARKNTTRSNTCVPSRVAKRCIIIHATSKKTRCPNVLAYLHLRISIFDSLKRAARQILVVLLCIVAMKQLIAYYHPKFILALSLP